MIEGIPSEWLVPPALIRSNEGRELTPNPDYQGTLNLHVEY